VGSVEKGELGVQLGSWRRYHESGEDENRSDVQRTRERESVVFLRLFYLFFFPAIPNPLSKPKNHERERDKT